MSDAGNPVIICGAGPSGCVLALLLAKNEIPVVLLERETDLPVDLRASTFHPPSLDMIADLDGNVIEQMLERGLRVDRYQYRDRKTGEVASFDMSLIADETRHPFRLQLEQYELTRIIVAELEHYDHVEARFGHEALGFVDHGDHVDVEVCSGDNTLTLRGAFVIGAEGAR